MSGWRKALWRASQVFAPDFPRQSSSADTIQAERTSRREFVTALQEATESGMPGYYSVYSFPRGHSKHGHIPKVDCVFIDLDVPGHMYDPDAGFDHFDSWESEMSELLARARMLASAIEDAGEEQHFRAVLSGHKGIHLYLDFPAVDPDEGNMGQFKAGLRSYGNGVMSWIDGMAGGIDMDPWVDVDASDLGRLARHPNTRHHGAAYDDTDRWCVPVTIGELSALDVDGYLALTSGPRPLPDGYERTPSQTAHDKVVQHIRTASRDGSPSGGSNKTKSKWRALKEYKTEQQNDDIDLDDVLFLTRNKPCFEAFRERDDAYNHGQASRTMELSIMGRLLDMGVPVDVIHEFFEPIPGYEEATTDSILGDLLARGNEYGEFNCRTICGGLDAQGNGTPGKAPQFCLDDDCSIYQRNDDLSKRWNA